MYNEVIDLIKLNKVVNEYGDIETQNEVRKIFVAIKSISQSEFYQADAVGMKPEIKFILADYLDYENEKELIYQNEKYSVIRTYRTNNNLEIVCQRGIEDGNS